MIHVLATISLTPGSRDEFLKVFSGVVPLVRAEEGCLEYGAAVDLETSLAAQDELRQDTVVVLEKWTSCEALEKHLMAPHMIDFQGRVKELVTGIQLQVLEPVSDPR